MGVNVPCLVLGRGKIKCSTPTPGAVGPASKQADRSAHLRSLDWTLRRGENSHIVRVRTDELSMGIKSAGRGFTCAPTVDKVTGIAE